MATIKIPSTPRNAYDPKRAANALLLSHVRELEKEVAKRGRKVRKQTPKTEEQVALYMRHLNRALYQQIVLPDIRRRPLDVPLGLRRTRKKSTASKRKPASRSKKHSAGSRKARRGRKA